MDIKSLIVELLEYPVDLEISLNIASDEEDLDIEDFILSQEGFHYKHLEFSMKLPNHVILDKGSYEELQDEKRDLENKVADLTDEVDSLNKQIHSYEMDQ